MSADSGYEPSCRAVSRTTFARRISWLADADSVPDTSLVSYFNPAPASIPTDCLPQQDPLLLYFHSTMLRYHRWQTQGQISDQFDRNAESLREQIGSIIQRAQAKYEDVPVLFLCGALAHAVVCYFLNISSVCQVHAGLVDLITRGIIGARGIRKLDRSIELFEHITTAALHAELSQRGGNDMLIEAFLKHMEATDSTAAGFGFDFVMAHALARGIQRTDSKSFLTWLKSNLKVVSRGDSTSSSSSGDQDHERQLKHLMSELEVPPFDPVYLNLKVLNVDLQDQFLVLIKKDQLRTQLFVFLPKNDDHADAVTFFVHRPTNKLVMIVLQNKYYQENVALSIAQEALRSTRMADFRSRNASVLHASIIRVLCLVPGTIPFGVDG